MWGSRRTLSLQVVLSVASLTCLSLAIAYAVNLGFIIALGLLSALSSPAIDAAVRTSWRSVSDDQAELSLLHTADSLLEEAGFLVGPTLAAGLMLTLGYRWSPLAIALAVCLNTLCILLSPAVRNVLLVDPPARPASDTAATTGQGSWIARAARVVAGPILQRELRDIVTPIVLMGGSFGVLAIALPYIAARSGSMATSGFLTALISLGGLIGGLVYGVLGTRGTARTRQSFLGILFGVPIAFLLLARSPWLVGPILLVGGLAVTPLYINSYLLIDGIISAEVKHEANSWVPVANDLGYIIGISAGGVLLSRVSLSAALALAASFALVLVVVSVWGFTRRKQANENASLQAQDAVA